MNVGLSTAQMGGILDHMDAKDAQIAQAVAAELRARRARLEISQAELAQASGIGERTIQRIEGGDRSVKLGQLDALCRALNVTMTDFIASALLESGKQVE